MLKLINLAGCYFELSTLHRDSWLAIEQQKLVNIDTSEPAALAASHKPNLKP
jgi:hypothetical protein